ncbi:batten's disease protein Cln3 [Colletotrichum godetiae]|uniref:Protein BTN n=1 Tax=Colletotrichum godetiae TaxID=1209918 RepID=A0AAJ0AAF5_9PEZI|nr:batten's disease protein Cln3 [Colletotrichum godetiae]KAK1658823.1 batten's disease protein Cln3 [Colletotrichum godetiae]
MASRSKTTARAAWSFDEFRIFLAFALIGLTNTILPSLIHAANYLIIPYPRHIVILIEVAPVLLTKLTLPFIIHRIPCRIRPLLVAVVWVILKRIADDTPPNVPPPIRIATTIIASAASAAMEVSCLGTLGQAGLPGLAGWGFGTGAGSLENAAWPFLLTYGAGKLLRSATTYIYYAVALLLVAHFVVLPPRFSKRCTKNDARGKQHENVIVEEGQSFLWHDRSAGLNHERSRFESLRNLIRSEISPLFIASAAMSLPQYGLARPLEGSAFETFAHFYTTYGMALHLGVWIGRSSLKILPVRNLRLHMTTLFVWVALSFFNAMFLVSTHLAFFMVFLIGLAAGSVYVNVLARLVGEGRETAAREVGVGFVTAGDAGGLLVGGVVGSLLEMTMCRSLVDGKRWCNRAR